MNIAYSCNEAYVQHTGISMISLLENNLEAEDINVYFVAKDVSDESVTVLQNICDKYSRNFILIPFQSICYDLEINSTGRHTETVYAKLFFSRINSANKIIYLDSDVIVNGSLKEMWETDLGDNYFGLTKTITKTKAPLLGLSLQDNFYNDGVAIVNCSLLRKDDMISNFVSAIKSFDGDPPVLSEGIINKVCKGRILSMPPKYNFAPIFFMFSEKTISNIAGDKNYYSKKEVKEAKESPAIIHYLEGWYGRPWSIYCTHPLKSAYLKYKEISPWKDISLEEKKLSKNARRMKMLYQYFPFFPQLYRWIKSL